MKKWMAMKGKYLELEDNVRWFRHLGLLKHLRTRPVGGRSKARVKALTRKPTSEW